MWWRMRNAQRVLPACLALALALATASPAFATVLLPADLATIVSDASIIVHGRVVEIRSALTGPRRTIDSFITVAVIETMKGDPGSTVTFRVPNGQVGRYRRILVGAPEFVEGEEVVVFLQGRAPAMPTPVGLSQGVYRVRRAGAAQAMAREVGLALRGMR